MNNDEWAQLVADLIAAIEGIKTDAGRGADVNFDSADILISAARNQLGRQMESNQHVYHSTVMSVIYKIKCACGNELKIADSIIDNEQGVFLTMEKCEDCIEFGREEGLQEATK